MAITQQYQVEFEGNRLDLVSGVNLYNYDFTMLPTRDIKIHKLARRSLSIITSSEYSQKSIPLWADICSGDRQDTEATITQLKALIQAQNGSLRVLESGQEVEYTATLNEFNIEWNGQHAYCTIVFIASDPLGRVLQDNELANIVGVTVPSITQTINVAGSYTAEPVISVSISSVTGATPGTINVYNSRTNQGITVEANYTDGDILVIDCLNYTVQINGANHDFEGIFPTFPPGAQQIGYSDTFSTRNVNISATYNPRLV